MKTATRCLVALPVLLLAGCGQPSTPPATATTTVVASFFGSVTPSTVTVTTTTVAAAQPTPEPTTETAETTVDPLVDVTGGIVRTYDGDTVTVLVDGQSHNVRILGISAPEVENEGLGIAAQCWGGESADAVAALLPHGTEVTLVIDPQQGDGPEFTDKFGRWLRYVEIRTREGTTDVGEHQIRSGNATVYEEYPVNRTDFYRQAQSAAQDDLAGLWAACPR